MNYHETYFSRKKTNIFASLVTTGTSTLYEWPVLLPTLLHLFNELLQIAIEEMQSENVIKRETITGTNEQQ